MANTNKEPVTSLTEECVVRMGQFRCQEARGPSRGGGNGGVGGIHGDLSLLVHAATSFDAALVRRTCQPRIKRITPRVEPPDPKQTASRFRMAGCCSAGTLQRMRHEGDCGSINESTRHVMKRRAWVRRSVPPSCSAASISTDVFFTSSISSMRRICASSSGYIASRSAA
jgi:hypothetical protein